MTNGAVRGDWQSSVLDFDASTEYDGKLLIEEVHSFVSLHRLCMYAYIVCRAKRLKPVFLCSTDSRVQLGKIVSRYFQDHELIVRSPLSRFDKLGSFVSAGMLWLRVLFRRDLVTVKRNGSLIGDIIYDQYLSSCRSATIHYFDWRLAKTIYQINRALLEAGRVLGDIAPVAVLLSHKVGISAAPLAVVAEDMKLSIYSFGGGRFGTLLKSDRRVDYEYYVHHDALAPLLDLREKDFKDLFQTVSANLLAGRIHSDATRAYRDKVYTDRQAFCDDFGLAPGKKNIFLMLHAFNDYPHSHFKGMLFDDYYDWFIKTLDHALSNDTVNWIVKQHPSQRLYTTDDVDWNAIKRKYAAPHICFLPEDAGFSSQSIGHIGDAVVTCIGSAGFELPALGGVAAYTAGDNPYANAGYAICPATREDYYRALSTLADVEKLTPGQHKRAQATFIFMHHVARVEMLTIPEIGEEQSRALEFSLEYFDEVQRQLDGRLEEGREQLARYVRMVQCKNFRLLQTIPDVSQ